MLIKRTVVVSLAVLALAAPAVAVSPDAEERPAATPGASGVGDRYFPKDGNGGYDVRHYDLDLRYQPASDRLSGLATISATSTKKLSRFNLDLVGLKVNSIKVDGKRAAWSRKGHELRVRPHKAIGKREKFRVKVAYAGVPVGLEGAGFVHTDEGALVIGQPHVAASWYPVNDHPTDAASYTFHITAPQGRSVLSNGNLVKKATKNGLTTWTWYARDPMASYLTTLAIGGYDTKSYTADGIKYVDAIDSDLLEAVAVPTDGSQFAISQQANSAYKRLQHTISVPADGATIDFTMTRDTETDWDFVFVEAHTVGQDDWTTLEDVNGHTTQETGNSCLEWPDLHPFISSHYQTVDVGAETCTAEGATGEWWGASGASDGPEDWQVDLGEFAGSTVELSISYVGDGSVPLPGVFVDDVQVSTGEGTTSFESGLEGWTVPGPPAGSPGNENDWIVGDADAVPESTGDIAAASLARQPEINGFLADAFGPYPWPSSGGIVFDTPGLGFALETQTRPAYAPDFFTDSVSGDGVVVHELAHQWFGDSVRLNRWRDIWLNEAFATYAEWLWSEYDDLGTAQENADFWYSNWEADDPFWQLPIGNPGPDGLFDNPVYYRGALTLHALRLQVGDDDFFEIVKSWPQARAGKTGTTAQFIATAERISGEQLDDLFELWLYSPGRPPAPTLAPSSTLHPAPPSEISGLGRIKGLAGR